MKRLFQLIVLCTAGGCVPQFSLQAQEPTAVIPPPSASIGDSATKISEKPIAFTPLQGAQQLYLIGEFDRAIEQYRAMLTGGAVDAVAYAGIARAYLKLKKPDEAFAAASKAVELDPFLPAAHSALGEVYIRQGKLYEAQEQFLQPFKDHQTDARAYLGLQRLYQASFNYKRAKVAIDKAHELAPEDPDISGAWIGTRPLSERIKAAESLIASPTKSYSRAALDGVRHNLAVMKDEAEHPERTCKLASPPETAEFPLVRAGSTDHPTGLLAVDASVNAQKARLVVTTDRTMPSINGQIAEKANIQRIVQTDIDGLGENNPPEGYIGFARSISVGNFNFENCYVRVVQEASRGSIFDRTDGEISLPMFANYLVDLDLPHAKLSLQPLPKPPLLEDPGEAAMDSSDPDAAKHHDRYVSPEMASWSQLYQFGGDLFIPAKVNDSPPELFGISISSTTNSLSSAFSQKWAPLKDPGALSVQNLPASSLYGIDGQIKTSWSGPVKLDFAGFYFGAVAERSIDLGSISERHGVEINGVLGLEVLHNIRTTIDYRDGLIHFDNTWHAN